MSKNKAAESRKKAEELVRRWQLNVQQARYSGWGNFYNLLKHFPAALLDENGYYLIPTSRDLQVKGIRCGKRINVAKGISSLPGYVRADGVSLPEVRADNVLLPEELPGEGIFEGARRTVTINAYERDPNARILCLQHWGTVCVVCAFDFAKVYGPEYAGYIHVHHLVPLSKIGRRYRVDPKNDLRPVCPNCHAAIHRDPSTPISIEELKAKVMVRL